MVLWNGERLPGFTPTRGLRQGDPLSPYLFVLCLERLSHLITEADSANSWKPIQISNPGPSLSHVFFADDIILMSEASLEQACVIKNILRLFCDSSGQKVSFQKSRVFFSPNTSPITQQVICDEMEVSSTLNLGRYLGVPVIHDRVNKETYKSVVERVKSRLSGWKAHSLSLAGRTTLVKSVTASIPIYTMQTVMLLVSILSRLDALNRKFIWGEIEEERKIHLINWQTLCLPKRKGGMGIRSMMSMNLALLTKLCWRMTTEPSTLWVRVLRDRHAPGCDGRDMFRTSKYRSPIWSSILKARNLFNQGIGMSVLKGNKVRFWQDKWLNGRELSKVVIGIIPEPEENVMVDFYWMDEGGWNWAHLQNLLPTAILFQLASIVIFADSENEDRVIWVPSKTGCFSVNSAYSLLNSTEMGAAPLEENGVNLWGKIWSLEVPERIRCFVWLTVHDKILSNVNRCKRKLASSDMCDVCSSSENTLHILRDCWKARAIWADFIPINFHSIFFSGDLAPWLLLNLSQKSLWNGLSWPTVFATIIWWCWKWRNERIFDNSQSQAVSRREFLITQADDYSKAFKMSRANVMITKEILVGWRPPEAGWVKVNCDGACKGNPGYASAGGIIRDCRGKWLGGFTVNLGICNSVLAEMWGLYFGLQVAWEKGFKKACIELDSSTVVRYMEQEASVPVRLMWLVDRCRDFKSRDWEIRVVHSLRKGNKVADWMANYAGTCPLGYHECDLPPAGVHDLLLDDASGSVFPRVVRS